MINEILNMYKTKGWFGPEAEAKSANGVKIDEN